MTELSHRLTSSGVLVPPLVKCHSLCLLLGKHLRYMRLIAAFLLKSNFYHSIPRIFSFLSFLSGHLRKVHFRQQNLLAATEKNVHWISTRVFGFSLSPLDLNILLERTNPGHCESHCFFRFFPTLAFFVCHFCSHFSKNQKTRRTDCNRQCLTEFDGSFRWKIDQNRRHRRAFSGFVDIPMQMTTKTSQVILACFM